MLRRRKELVPQHRQRAYGALARELQLSSSTMLRVTYTTAPNSNDSRRRRRSRRGIALLVLAVTACTNDDESEASSTSLQTAVDAIVATGAPGVVAFRRSGPHVAIATSGVRDLATGEPIDARDRFRGGSTSKPLLATVVLQLAEEGVLALDDSVERWLPGVLPRGSAVSLRQLLNHTSGIPNSAHDPHMLEPYLRGEHEYYWSPAELVAMSAARPLAFEPGQGYLYSNSNYHLLGLVTRRDPIAEVTRRLLESLGLEASDWPVSEPQIDGRHTRGYHFGPEFGTDADVTVFSPSWAWTAGGLISDVTDLASFNRALLRGELLQPGSMSEMLTAVPNDEDGYGLGLMRWNTPCGEGWGHEGDFPGYHSLAITSRDGERQAVVAINSDDAIGITLGGEPLLARAVYAAFCE
jgi:D-alanyl-D-alanine carboxypeptidase